MCPRPGTERDFAAGILTTSHLCPVNSAFHFVLIFVPCFAETKANVAKTLHFMHLLPFARSTYIYNVQHWNTQNRTENSECKLHQNYLNCFQTSTLSLQETRIVLQNLQHNLGMCQERIFAPTTQKKK